MYLNRVTQILNRRMSKPWVGFLIDFLFIANLSSSVGPVGIDYLAIGYIQGPINILYF